MDGSIEHIYYIYTYIYINIYKERERDIEREREIDRKGYFSQWLAEFVTHSEGHCNKAKGGGLRLAYLASLPISNTSMQLSIQVSIQEKNKLHLVYKSSKPVQME